MSRPSPLNSLEENKKATEIIDDVESPLLPTSESMEISIEAQKLPAVTNNMSSGSNNYINLEFFKESPNSNKNVYSHNIIYANKYISNSIYGKDNLENNISCVNPNSNTIQSGSCTSNSGCGHMHSFCQDEKQNKFKLENMARPPLSQDTTFKFALKNQKRTFSDRELQASFFSQTNEKKLKTFHPFLTDRIINFIIYRQLILLYYMLLKLRCFIN
jgi:hypothetical protein